MKGHFAIILAGALAAGGASLFAIAQAQPVHTIILRDSRQIADASAVNEALNALVNAAQSCSPTDMKARTACVCKRKTDVSALRVAYDRAIARNPTWNGSNTAVNYVDPRNRRSVGMIFPGLKRQIDLCARY
jgi:hypothetical protein